MIVVADMTTNGKSYDVSKRWFIYYIFYAGIVRNHGNVK